MYACHFSCRSSITIICWYNSQKGMPSLSFRSRSEAADYMDVFLETLKGRNLLDQDDLLRGLGLVAACARAENTSLVSPPRLSLVFDNRSTDPSALDTPRPASLSILRPSIPRSYIPFFAGYPPPAPNGIRRRNNRSSWLRYPLRAAQRPAR